MGQILKSIKGFMGPAKYIQGAGLLNQLGEYTTPFGDKLIAFIDDFLYESIAKQLEGVYGGRCQNVKFSGQVSLENAKRYIGIAKQSDASVVLGIGGGRTMDMAKLVANETGLSQVIIPTSASTDAPTSALSVIYTEEGKHSHEIFYDKGPDLVLVDTDVIAAAPIRLLVSGMGDAMATLFEARANLISDSTTNMKGGYKQTLAAYAIAKECYAVLLRDGYNAKLAAEAGALSPALDNIIEVNTLLSGVGAETNGASGAHAFHDGFTVLAACHNKLHGEKVSFGVVCQLVLENRPPEELEEVLQFACSVGLPVCMADLGVTSLTSEDARAIAKAVMASPLILRECLDVNEDLIFATILAADKIGSNYKATH
ncbi:MAG: glycerol dehydrogenase [Treponema sp.]|jgi:glycerol dehydrogenase|nr:glycerol dehydrogenase [Treponema sp.]